MALEEVILSDYVAIWAVGLFKHGSKCHTDRQKSIRTLALVWYKSAWNMVKLLPPLSFWFHLATDQTF